MLQSEVNKNSRKNEKRRRLFFVVCKKKKKGKLGKLKKRKKLFFDGYYLGNIKQIPSTLQQPVSSLRHQGEIVEAIDQNFEKLLK